MEGLCVDGGRVVHDDVDLKISLAFFGGKVCLGCFDELGWCGDLAEVGADGYSSYAIFLLKGPNQLLGPRGGLFSGVVDDYVCASASKVLGADCAKTCVRYGY